MCYFDYLAEQYKPLWYVAFIVYVKVGIMFSHLLNSNIYMTRIKNIQYLHILWHNKVVMSKILIKLNLFGSPAYTKPLRKLVWEQGAAPGRIMLQKKLVSLEPAEPVRPKLLDKVTAPRPALWLHYFQLIIFYCR